MNRSGISSEIDQVISTVVRSISLETLELTDEFFPAHLSIALVDAVFRTRYQHGELSIPSAEHYCRQFGLARTRGDKLNLPPANEQETLGDLIQRYDELGLDAMSDDVFGIRPLLPRTTAHGSDDRPARRQSTSKYRGRRSAGRIGSACRRNQRRVAVLARGRLPDDPTTADVHRRRRLRPGRRARTKFRVECRRPGGDFFGRGGITGPKRRSRADSFTPIPGSRDLAVRSVQLMESGKAAAGGAGRGR